RHVRFKTPGTAEQHPVEADGDLLFPHPDRHPADRGLFFRLAGRLLRAGLRRKAGKTGGSSGQQSRQKSRLFFQLFVEVLEKQAALLASSSLAEILDQKTAERSDRTKEIENLVQQLFILDKGTDTVQ